MKLLMKKITIQQPELINNCFVSGFISQYAKRYNELTSILPDHALYRSAARIYKSSGLSIFLNADPSLCYGMATLKSKNPHMKRFSYARGYETFKQSELCYQNEESYNYNKAMEEKGFSKGISILKGNNIFTDGIGLLGDDFFREKQFQENFENELKYIMKELNSIFNCIENEYRLSRIHLLNIEKNRIEKYTKFFEKKLYLIKIGNDLI